MACPSCIRGTGLPGQAFRMRSMAYGLSVPSSTVAHVGLPVHGKNTMAQHV
jgi:hypothetical protein